MSAANNQSYARSKISRGIPWFACANGLFMMLVGFFTLYPFWNIVVYSFNDALDSLRGGLYFWPREFTLYSYQSILENKIIYNATLNSVLRTISGTVLSVFCTMMLAYTLSRKEYMFRKPILLLFVLTLFFSGGLIPSYMLIRELGLIGTFLVYIVPGPQGIISAFNLIIMRTFIEGLPEGIIESAKMDGASDFKVFMRIIFPLSMPVVATVGLFVMVAQWNAWFDTFLFNSMNPNLSTLQYELMKILQSVTVTVSQSNNFDPTQMQQQATTSASVRSAMTIIASVPIVLVYPFIQKYFVKGFLIGGIKE